MDDNSEELMQTISRALPKVAMRINDIIVKIAKDRVDWFLIVHTNPRASYIGTEQGTKDAPELLQDLLDRWDGTIFPLPKEATPRMLRLRPQLRRIAEIVHGELCHAARRKPVLFSLVIDDVPNSPIYLANANRDDVIKSLPSAIAMLKTGEHVPVHEVT